jgi:RNase adaptor protein for sRNA GlmZ degradation
VNATAPRVALLYSGSFAWVRENGPIPEWENAAVRCDVRELANPFDVPGLHDLSGLDLLVQEFIAAQPAWSTVRDDLLAGLSIAWSSSTIATATVLCTGGRDRSVAVVELLAGELTAAGVEVCRRHLHLYRQYPWVPHAQRLGT